MRTSITSPGALVMESFISFKSGRKLAFNTRRSTVFDKASTFSRKDGSLNLFVLLKVSLALSGSIILTYKLLSHKDTALAGMVNMGTVYHNEAGFSTNAWQINLSNQKHRLNKDNHL